MTHHHLSRDERVSLAALLRAGHSKSNCARQLGVNRSTITRELGKNPGEYRAIAADKKAKKVREESKQKKRKIENDKLLEKRIIQLLKRGLSPEQISEETRVVGDDAVYAWIERSRKDLAVLLPQRGRVRHKYGKDRTQVQGWTKLVRSIETRPKMVETRSRIGDWEGDTIVGRDHVPFGLSRGHAVGWIAVL